jgi:hypothetical protein
VSEVFGSDTEVLPVIKIESAGVKPKAADRSLGELANIHVARMPYDLRPGTLEFLFLKEDIWHKFYQNGDELPDYKTRVPLTTEELKKFSDARKYVLMGPADENPKGTKWFALYEKTSNSNLYK